MDREIFWTVIAGRRLLLKAQVAARVQIAAAVQVVNHLTTAQVRKDAHSKAAEQTTEISTEVIDREFVPIMTNQERGVQKMEFMLQQMHTMLTDLTSGEANDIVANSLANPLEVWRRLKKRYDPTAGGRKRTFFVLSFLRNGALFWISKRELNAGSPLYHSTRRC